MKFFLPKLLLLWFMCAMVHLGYSQCGVVSYTVGPNATPVEGTAGSITGTGTTADPFACSDPADMIRIDFCVDLTEFNELVLNWAHGVFLQNAPAGSTVTLTTAAQLTTGDLDDNPVTPQDHFWTPFNAGPAGPGYYVDNGDSDPTNNLGDPGDGGGSGLTTAILANEMYPTLTDFCFQVDIPCAAMAGTWEPSIGLSGDGETGSWTAPNVSCFLFGYRPTMNGANGNGSTSYQPAGAAPPSNDIPSAATDISATLVAANTDACGFSCDAAARIFSDATTIPSASEVTPNDADDCDSSTKPDIWFSFVYNGENVWLDVYADPTNGDDFVAAIYDGGPSAAPTVDDSNPLAITGLTYVDCADGDSGFGGNRDVGECTTPLHERLDVTGLTVGNIYYLRIWPDGGNVQTTTTEFYICAESNTPVSPALDTCGEADPDNNGGEPTVGCPSSAAPNAPISETYANQSNAGSTGNSDLIGCQDVGDILLPDNMSPGGLTYADNGQVISAGAPLGTITACGGGASTLTLVGANTVRNNNVVYSFDLNAEGLIGCQANLDLCFDNVSVCCGESIIQVEVFYFPLGFLDCDFATLGTSVIPVISGSVDVTGDNCFCLGTLLSDLPLDGLSPRTFYVSVEGVNGALVKYDMDLDVNYTGCTTSPFPCVLSCPPLASDPANDDPENATNLNTVLTDASIMAALNNAANTCGWTCTDNTQTYADGAITPTTTFLEGPTTPGVEEPVACDGVGDKRDIWYNFTYDPALHGNTWLDIYSDPTNPIDFAVALYSETSPGTPPTTDGVTCLTTGLTYIDCAFSDDGLGGDRDVGECTTPLHARIDLSGLTPGDTYYVRIWEEGGGAPTQGGFYMCAEQGSTVTPAVDVCSQADPANTADGNPTLGCPTGAGPNAPVVITYPQQSNAGATGNSDIVGCNDPGDVLLPDNMSPGGITYGDNGLVPAIGSLATATACDGSASTVTLAAANLVRNNNVWYSFEVDGTLVLGCQAEINFCFDNIDICCGESEVQMEAYYFPTNSCDFSLLNTTFIPIVATSVDVGANSCFCISTLIDALVDPGVVYVSIEGVNGALVKYDLTLDISYDNCGTNPFPCVIDCTPNANDPANDDPDTATDISTIIADADIMNMVNNAAGNCGWTCTDNALVYADASTTPTITYLEDPANPGQEEVVDCDNVSDKRDIWYSFTYDPAIHGNTWLDIYTDPANPVDLAVALYEETTPGTAPMTDAGSCITTGLSYIDCAFQDDGLGGDRDVSECTTPLHSKIDISGLTPGQTYYVRVWEEGGGIPTLGNFYMCVEQNTTVGPAVDTCVDAEPGNNGGDPTIGCPDGTPANAATVVTYPQQSNAGATGNSDLLCTDVGDLLGQDNTAPDGTVYGDNGAIVTAGAPLGTITSCDGSASTLILAAANGGRNNNVFYSFGTNGSGALCMSEINLCLDNVDVCCGETSIEVEAFYSATGTCNLLGVVGTDVFPVFSGSIDVSGGASCFCLTSLLDIALNPDLIYVSIQGSNGSLVKYDMTLDVSYDGCDSAPFPCPITCDDMSSDPGNDDPDTATDISTLIADADIMASLNNAGGTCGWACAAGTQTYADGNNNEPTITFLEDPNMAGQEQPVPCDMVTDKRDIWYSFTYDPALHGNTWLDIYTDPANPVDLAVALYEETIPGTPPTTDAATCLTTGLTYIDCSYSDQGLGDDRDVSECTTPLHSKIDLSGLTAGQTYYVRVWEEGGGTPTSGGFYMCVEQGTTVGPAVDVCNDANPANDADGDATLGCPADAPANSPFSHTLTGQSNAGATGNSSLGCDDLGDILEPDNMSPDGTTYGDNGQPLAVGGPLTTISDCTGTPTAVVLAGLNTVRNNNVFYSFLTNNDAPCLPQIDICFDNVQVCCGETGFQVELYYAPVQALACDFLGIGTNIIPLIAGTVDVSDPALPGTASGACFCFSSILDALPGGVGSLLGPNSFFLSVEGTNGALVKYDMSVDVSYGGVGCTPEIPCDPLVAVDLTSFTGKVTESANVLEWATASEVDNDYFVVERSVDGKTFEELGKVTGAGNSLTTQRYAFNDINPTDLAYYRLRIVEIDGSFEYSHVVALKRSKEKEITVYPIPTTDRLYINATGALESDEVQIEIVDVLGRTLISKMVEAQDRMQIDVSDLSTGVYHMILRDGVSQITKRVVIE